MTSRSSLALGLARLGGGASLVAFVACGATSKPADPPVAPSLAAPDPAPSSSALDAGPPDTGPPGASLPPGVPDTAAGRRLAWVIASFAQPPSDIDVEAHFTPDFRAHEPVRDLVVLFGRLGVQLAPVVIERVEPGSTPERLAVVARSDKPGTPPDAKMQISLTVEETEPHRIAGLTFRRLIDAKPATSWDEVQTRLKAVSPSVSFLAAELVGGQCAPISSIEPRKALAVGSTFQLYILEALAKQVAAGKRKWDDVIVIEDAKKSLMPGATRNEPAGKMFTVRELAERMISASDNTATDHLLALIGRQAVEAAVKASGNAAAARNSPFLSTRDVFALKLLGSADDLRAYAAADVPHRRMLLAGYEKRDLSSASEAVRNGWSKPRMVDSIEWFAAPDDLCKLMLALKGHADAPATAPVGEILSANPGLPDEASAYKYIGFKGGSEPGVANMTWLLQRKSDDKWLFLAVTFNDTGAAIDDKRAVAATMAARDFMGK